MNSVWKQLFVWNHKFSSLTNVRKIKLWDEENSTHFHRFAILLLAIKEIIWQKPINRYLKSPVEGIKFNFLYYYYFMFLNKESTVIYCTFYCHYNHMCIRNLIVLFNSFEIRSSFSQRKRQNGKITVLQTTRVRIWWFYTWPPACYSFIHIVSVVFYLVR